MEVFMFCFSYAKRQYLLFSDFEVWVIYTTNIWLISLVFSSLICALFWFNWSVIIFELLFFGSCFLFGFSYAFLHVPYFSIQNLNTYLNVLFDRSGNSYDVGVEDFTPPFIFGYRKYFFSRIVGWAGTWASYLKHHRRRIKSSLADWGYKSRIPSWHYYTIRGGLRIRILSPNTFRRASGASYNSPMWFYSFPIKMKKTGFLGDEWDEYNWTPYQSKVHGHLFWLYREVERTRVRTLYLSSWVEKLAPSLSPTYRGKPDYKLAIGEASPYSYKKFYTYFFNSAKVSSDKQPTHLGMQRVVLVDKIEVQEILGRRKALPRLRKFMDYNKIPYDFWRMRRRRIISIGEHYLINKEALRMQNLSIRYAHHAVDASKEYDENYDYSKFLLLSWYHTFIEFFSLIFDSFYIYPFELKITSIEIFVEPISFFRNFMDFDLSEFFLLGVFNNNLMLYLGFLIFYFFTVMIMYHFFSLISSSRLFKARFLVL